MRITPNTPLVIYQQNPIINKTASTYAEDIVEDTGRSKI